MFCLSRFHLAPIRPAVPFFHVDTFRPKTNLKVNRETLIPALKARLGSDLYRQAVFVRRRMDYLIVLKGKVCGYYSPIPCLPPPTALSAMPSEDVVIKGGQLTVAQYLDCLEALGADYRSFYFFSMHHGCLLFTIDRDGVVPKTSKLGIRFMATSSFLKGSSQMVSEDHLESFESGDQPFVSRFGSHGSADASNNLFPTENLMQAGFHSQYFKDLLQLIGDHFDEEIDVCPTWWKRIAVLNERSRETTLFDRLSAVARQLARPEDAGGAGHRYAMDMNDRRWTDSPVLEVDPSRFVRRDGTPDLAHIRDRMQYGFLKLDF